MDGRVTTPGIFQPDRWGIHSQSCLHAVIGNEWAEAVPGWDVHMHVRAGKRLSKCFSATFTRKGRKSSTFYILVS